MPDRGDTDTTWYTLWATSAVFTYEATVSFITGREEETLAAFDQLVTTNQRMGAKFGGVRQRELLLALNGLNERYLALLVAKSGEPHVREPAVEAWLQQGRVIATWLVDEARSRHLATDTLHFHEIFDLYLNNVMMVVIEVTRGRASESMRHLVSMLNASCGIASAFSLVDIPMSDSIRGMINRIRR